MSNLVYVCSSCQARSPKWSGRCLSCGAWGSLREEIEDKGKKAPWSAVAPAETIDLATLPTAGEARLATGQGEIDRVFGGGFVPGAVALIAGEPGIGKSTLVLEIAGFLGPDHPQLYVSGEESARQVKDRLDRLPGDFRGLRFLAETSIEKIISTLAASQPALAIIDSVQTMAVAAVPSEPGNIAQIRAVTAELVAIAKKTGLVVLLIGHVTKDGQAAGPKSLEHMVDTVIYLEEEKSRGFRILRAAKNRFGSTNEIGIFTMTGRGFEAVPNPSSAFIHERAESQPGSVISAIMEGTRPFLAEIQALTTKTVFGWPQRKAAGLDVNRLQILAAVLHKRADINLANQDVIVNLAGGLKAADPALDLAICLAVISSLLNQPLGRRTMAVGEVGLGGEIRPPGKLKARLREAAKLGYTAAIVPAGDYGQTGLKIIAVDKLADLVPKIFTPPSK